MNEWETCIAEWADRCQALSDESAALRARVEELEHDRDAHAAAVRVAVEHRLTVEQQLAERDTRIKRLEEAIRITIHGCEHAADPHLDHLKAALAKEE